MQDDRTPIIREIDLQPFPNLNTKEMRDLHAVFARHQHELRVAGGAVRDVLLGREPADIDFASEATPSEMTAMFDSEGLRMLNKNGIAHGTVTVRMNDAENFEVTTLRIDTEHDGRRAQVTFTKDWGLDAERRDLTINSMFLKLHYPDESTVKGTLIDYFNGSEDLQKRVIRFVGEPADRICEDYLRILRYFRFHGRLSTADHRDYHEQHTLDAIKSNSSGLAGISGERLWVELRRILICPSAYHLINRMNDCDVLPRLGFPDKLNTKPLERLNAAIKSGINSFEPSPATMLSCLLHDESEIADLHKRLKLSNKELQLLQHLVHNRQEYVEMIQGKTLPEQLAYYVNFHALQHDSKRTSELIEETIKLLASDVESRKEMLQMWRDYQPAKFPVNGYMLTQAWQITGRGMALVIDELKRIWVKSNFTMGQNELLSQEIKQDLIARNIINRTALATTAAGQRSRSGSREEPATR